jgi:hypothetical protein
MFFQVSQGLLDPSYAVTKASEPDVAVLAQQPANNASLVTVVNAVA